MPWGAGTAAILLRLVAGPVLARRDQAVLGGIGADHRVGVVAVEVAAGAGRGVLEHLDTAEIVAEALAGPIERLALSLRGAPQDLAGLAHLGRRVLHPVAQHLLVERPRAPHVEHQGEVALEDAVRCAHRGVVVGPRTGVDRRGVDQGEVVVRPPAGAPRAAAWRDCASLTARTAMAGSPMKGR